MTITAPSTTTATVTASAALDAIVSRDEFERALDFTKAAVPTRAPVPVLAGVLLTARGDQLVLSAFDFETSTTDFVGAPGASGRALVEHRTLQRIVKSLPKGAVVSLRAEGGKVRVSDGVTTFTVLEMDAADYPDLPEVPASVLLTMTGQGLWEVVSKVAVSASRDATLPLLCGIAFSTDGGTVTLLSTDRYRLGAYATGQATALDRTVVVNAKVLSGLARLFRAAGTVAVTASTSGDGHPMLGITDGTRSATVLETDGDFPDAARLFPAETTTAVQVDSAEVLLALKQVEVAIERNTPAHLAFSDQDAVTVRAGGDDTMTAERPMTGTITVTGARVESVALNPGFLADGVKACGGAATLLQLTHSNKPVVFTDPQDPAYRYLLVPVRFAA